MERDACDQFVARRLESGTFREQGVEDFLPVLAASRGAFERVRAALPPEKAQARLRLLRFEDFLRDPAVGAGLLDWLGLPAAGTAADAAKFDAAVSARNIGIHAGQLGPDDVARIERNAGRYLR
ncbi:hypothetical protein HK414_14840 [Ramlibacter terrae]|uniref:Swt1-like HEPN domain-containing protein n=1 Tax=Ramlibacter terrae TaxID=2732511 RepID=A0ABX6P3A0_9BURK|nr:hypothetical protein HK414_14840 [Ramlibacter terrae]